MRRGIHSAAPAIRSFLRGAVRHGVLLGSAAAVLLIGAVTGVVLHRGGSTECAVRARNRLAVAGRSGRAGRARQPPRSRRGRAPPTFDIVKVGPTGTAVIAGRAEPGSRVTVRDGDKIIGEVTADAPRRMGARSGPADRPGRPSAVAGGVEPGGDAITKSDETVALSIAPAAPGRQGETALAVVLPRDGGGAAQGAAAAGCRHRPEGRARSR